MYLVINKCVTTVKVSHFSGHYLRNRSTLNTGVLGYIGIVQHKEHSPEVLSIPPGTPCIYQVHTHTHTFIWTIKRNKRQPLLSSSDATQFIWRVVKLLFYFTSLPDSRSDPCSKSLQRYRAPHTCEVRTQARMDAVTHAPKYAREMPTPT